MDQTKKIILVSLGMALIAFFIGGGTYAYFSDVERVQNSTFTAGTLDLVVGNITVPVVVDPLKPGDSNESFAVWNLTNSGNVDGILNVSVGVVRNDENDRGEPELDVDNSSDTGELGANLEVALWVGNGTTDYYLSPGGGSLAWTTDETYSALNNFSGLDTTGNTATSPFLSANSTNTRFNIAYDLPYETGNEVQSDMCSFNITFTLRQQPQ